MYGKKFSKTKCRNNTLLKYLRYENDLMNDSGENGRVYTHIHKRFIDINDQ